MTFSYQPIFEKSDDKTNYRLVTKDGVSDEIISGRQIISIKPETIQKLTEAAFDDVSHLLRTSHLEKLAKILNDPESSDNDRFVATELLKNAVIAAERIFPSCQDTGTAIIMGKKGEDVYTGVNDEIAVSHGVFDAYKKRNLRYSQLAPLAMFEEKIREQIFRLKLIYMLILGQNMSFYLLPKVAVAPTKVIFFKKLNQS